MYNTEKMSVFHIWNTMCGYFLLGGDSRPLNSQTGPIVISSCPLTHINLHGKYESNVIYLIVYIEACILNKAFLFILF